MATDVDTFFKYMINLTWDNCRFIFYACNLSGILFTLGCQCIKRMGRMRALYLPLRITKERDSTMAAEPLVLVSFHTFKFSCHNLRPHSLVSVFYLHVPSATTQLSSPWVIWIWTMAHFSNSLLMELDKLFEVNIIHHVESAITFFFYKYIR